MSNKNGHHRPEGLRAPETSPPGICSRLVNVKGSVDSIVHEGVWVCRAGYRTFWYAIGKIGGQCRENIQRGRVGAGVGVVQFELYVNLIDICMAAVSLGDCCASHDSWNGNCRQRSEDQNNDHQFNQCEPASSSHLHFLSHVNYILLVFNVPVSSVGIRYRVLYLHSQEQGHF